FVLRLAVPFILVAGTADHDAVALHGDGHGTVAGPVLGVRGVVLDRRVEPQAVALLAVVEGALQRAGTSTPAPAAAAAAASPAPSRLPLAVAILLGVRLVRTRFGCGLGVQCGGHQRVVLGAEILLDVLERGALVAVGGLRRSEIMLPLEGHELTD